MGRDYRFAAGVVQASAPAGAECPGHFVVKHVTGAGTLRSQQHLLSLANALVDQWIGLEETDGGNRAIYFDTVLPATFDERDYIMRRANAGVQLRATH